MSSSDLYNLTLEASRDPITGEVKSNFILPRTFIVRQDSGIQNVYADIRHALNRARRMKHLRSYAIEMVYADFEALISISSERGAYLREFSTNRSALPLGRIEGQPVNDIDAYMYEDVLGDKEKFKNNPRQKGFGMNDL